MYEIAISFVSCFIVWLVWFLIAKSKNNRKQMLISTQCCFSCFIVLAWGALCGVACLVAYALINHLKKSFPEFPKEERENEHNHQQLAPSPDIDNSHQHRKDILDNIQSDSLEKTTKQSTSPVAVFFWIFMVVFFAFFAISIAFSISNLYNNY